MASNNVINEDELEFDGDQTTYNGRPFTGVGLLQYPNSRPKREVKYVNGFEEGPCREWYPNGQLKRDWFAVRGQAHGRVTEWYENEKRKSVGEYEHGVELRYDEWSDTGQLLVSREIDKASELFKYLEQVREKSGAKGHTPNNEA
jgi:antitoxin component YwqK of YwqJK toxin-antitoxin module